MKMQLVHGRPFLILGVMDSYRVYSSNDIACLYFESRITQTHTSVIFTIVYSCKWEQLPQCSIHLYPHIHTYSFH